MRIIHTAAEMHRARALLEGPVTLVATLGGMHEGHEALLRRARALGRSRVASLFLNPTQFGDPEDFLRYPHDTDRDLEIFEAHGVDVVFKPSVDEMYPAGCVTEVDPGPVASVLEGAHRPGHFRAVATVVTKILTVTRPDIAVWGAKDAQQNVVIRHLTRDLRMAVSHEIVPTVRAPDGLALSSRNARLTAEQRTAANVFHAALSTALGQWRAGERDAATLRRTVEARVQPEALATLEYVSLANPDSLEERVEAQEGDLLSLAGTIGRVRLIDNVILDRA
jgi:pantoate--beta-alanine ligase